MELRKWNVFLAVVDSGSFTKAGEGLGYTQSGITQMMKSLEQEVGFPLFHKGHHGVSLTKEGEALLPSIRNLFSANETLNQEISFLKGAKTQAALSTGSLKSSKRLKKNTQVFFLISQRGMNTSCPAGSAITRLISHLPAIRTILLIISSPYMMIPCWQSCRKAIPSPHTTRFRSNYMRMPLSLCPIIAI